MFDQCYKRSCRSEKRLYNDRVVMKRLKGLRLKLKPIHMQGSKERKKSWVKGSERQIDPFCGCERDRGMGSSPGGAVEEKRDVKLPVRTMGFFNSNSNHWGESIPNTRKWSTNENEKKKRKKGIFNQKERERRGELVWNQIPDKGNKKLQKKYKKRNDRLRVGKLKKLELCIREWEKVKSAELEQGRQQKKSQLNWSNSPDLWKRRNNTRGTTGRACKCF